MELSDPNKIYGVVDGIIYGQYDRLDEINSRIFERSVPDPYLPPNFNPRPVPTKYTVFPILDKRMPAKVPIHPSYDYSLETSFTPPVSKKGPVSGYFNNVDLENHLRNQYFALQKGADQSVYIPNKESDLYKVYVPSRPSTQPHPNLFQQYALDQDLHANIQAVPNLGREVFNNNTRVQLRNTTTM